LGHLKSVEARIMDRFQALVRDQCRDDLTGKERTDRLRCELHPVLNAVLKPERVRGVLFREIIME
jgi:flagellar basal body-associated protein FliL